MCLLALQQIGQHKKFTREQFHNMWASNNHGGGLGYYLRGEPVMIHTLDETEHWNNYSKAFAALTASITGDDDFVNLMIHFRIGTQGSRNTNNCHPFWVPVGKGAILGHNGYTRYDGIAEVPNWSDTRHLANLWIPKNTPEWWTDKSRKELLKMLGQSRLAIMDEDRVSLLQFPSVPNDLAEFGHFSNTYWNTTGSWGRGTSGINRSTSSYSTQSNEISDRALAYAIANNLSLLDYLIICHDTYNASFPTSSDFFRFLNQHRDALRVINSNENKFVAPPPHTLNAYPTPKNSIAMQEYWLAVQDRQWTDGPSKHKDALDIREALTSLKSPAPETIERK